MINVVLDLYLFDQLMDDFVIFDLCFSDDFDGKDKSCFLVSKSIFKAYLANLTFPNLPFPRSQPSWKSDILSYLVVFYEANVDIVYFKFCN